MEVCNELAMKAAFKGNAAVGCVILHEDQIIVQAQEAGHIKEDITCHAEIEAIRVARRKLGVDLSNCTLVTTHEPCVMCGYAIRFHKIGRVVYENEVNHFGSITSKMPILRTLDVPKHWSTPPEIIQIKV
jgi:tRNA(adenine34) deaminase